jgi:hypothetical protein
VRFYVQTTSCVRSGISRMWRRVARWLATDVSTYRWSFIFNGQIDKAALVLLDPEDGVTMIIETAEHVNQEHDATSWHVFVIPLKCELHKLSIIAMWETFVHSYQCHFQYRCRHTYVCVWIDHVGLPAEGNSSFGRTLCQRCSVTCQFCVVIVYIECRRFVSIALPGFSSEIRYHWCTLDATEELRVSCKLLNWHPYFIWQREPKFTRTAYNFVLISMHFGTEVLNVYLWYSNKPKQAFLKT